MKPGLVSIALLVLVSLSPRSYAAEPSANDVFRAAGKIVTPDGIDVDQMVQIGGINQWISIRSRHRDNPILLVLHGGPGFTTIPSSYYFLKGWDEYFAVVQWDQRGAGKTYLANDPAKVRPTMSLDRMVGDAEELVSYLRKTYGRKRIVLLAHSFGTVTGVKLAQRNPDWYHAYVGMGQLVDAQLNEKMGYDATLAAARADHNDKAVSELESIAPFPDPAHPERNMQGLPLERRWLAYYGGYYWHDNVGHEDALDQFSPDYTADELKARYEAMGFGIQALWDEAGHIDLRPVTQFGCPVIFLEGRHDLGTNATLLDQWFKAIKAPRKKLVWFDDSAHMVYQEEPGKTLVTLVNDVLPLTHRN
jgi:pimeloyl-ACP methyl ester carboxylesterase